MELNFSIYTPENERFYHTKKQLKQFNVKLPKPESDSLYSSLQPINLIANIKGEVKCTINKICVIKDLRILLHWNKKLILSN